MSGDGVGAAAGSAAGAESEGAVLATARRLSAAIAGGLIAGAVIGGFGGRVAMLVLRLTSDASLHGLETDDGFTIGIVSGATLFLLLLTVFGGVLGGVVYLAVRSWLPERVRPWVFGTLSGLVVGAAVIRPGGIDFTRLEPLGLAVAMFIALPVAYGVATSLLTERFLRDGSAFRTSRAPLLLLLGLLPLALLGLPVALALVAILIAVVLMGWGPGLARIWVSTTVTWLGRGALVLVAARASVELARDVTTVL